ncbi:MAG TPA: NUDIX hydrolase [Propionibacteriaceae bacterium]|nr:NUDIX hydrolase [Propionibacteriaceae bacterium]
MSGAPVPPASDLPHTWDVVRHEVLGRGRVSDFVEDDVLTPSGEQITRQYLTHPGAVAILALDEEDRVAVVDQYRHPVGMTLVEIPAGLLDAEGESWLAAAERELAEEALLGASDWRVLVDLLSSPGGNQETLRVFLARGLSPVARPEGFEIEGEEAHMSVHWVPFSELLEGVYNGSFGSPGLVVGVLAYEAARVGGRLDTLRGPHAVWSARAALTERG